jgi:hypothetical protein
MPAQLKKVIIAFRPENGNDELVRAGSQQHGFALAGGCG